jgi:hypothetical protein
MVLTQSAQLNSRQPRCFGLAQQYPPLKSHIVTLRGVHLTHQPRSSLGSPIHRGLMIEFTPTLLKPAGDPKPNRCGRRCDFSPIGVVVDEFGWVPRVWLWVGFCQTCLEPTSLPSLVVLFRSIWLLIRLEQVPAEVVVRCLLIA